MNRTDVIALLLCGIAAILHGLSGMGFPMISTAALSSIYSLSTAVALVLIPCLILNIFMLKTNDSQGFIKSITLILQKNWMLIFSSVIGSYIGVHLLLKIPEQYLKLALGSVILFYIADQLRKTPLHIATTPVNMLIFGLFAGVIGGATNAMAPFLMMYLLSSEHSKDEVVIISNLSFIVSKLIQLIILYPVILTFNEVQNKLLVLICVICLLFAWIGSKIRQHISQKLFKKIVLVLLSLLGCNALWQAYLLF